MAKHWVSKTCQGEYCRCGLPATHKVGEEIPSDAIGLMEALQTPGADFYQSSGRHNLTAYVCCDHFAAMMGDFAHRLCFAPPVEIKG